MKAPSFDRALELARRRHAGQLDKAGQPYIGHPERVAATHRQTRDGPLGRVGRDVVAGLGRRVGLDVVERRGCADPLLDDLVLLRALGVV